MSFQNRGVHGGPGGLKPGNRDRVIRFEQVRGLHVLVTEVANRQNVLDTVWPRRKDIGGVIRISAGVQSLPLGPKPIDIAVMSPEDWISGSRARRHHVSILWLVWELAEVRISAARKIVNQVMDVFDRTEKMVTARAATKVEKALNLKDPLNIFGVG